MKTEVKQNGVEITRFSHKEFMAGRDLTIFAQKHGYTRESAKEIKCLMDSHGMSRESAERQYKENMEWANS